MTLTALDRPEPGPRRAATRRIATGAARYAVYYAPPAGSALERFGWRWFGRGPDRRDTRRRAALPGIGSDERARVLAEPFRYAFHGTLKAPFRLAPGVEADELIAAVGALVERSKPVEAPALEIAQIERFLALRPAGASPELDDFAARCVRALEDYRAPLNADELARRRAAGLTPAQDALLERWGYPYVMEEFRFHMTLTARLAPERLLAWWRAAAEVAGSALDGPFMLDEVGVFQETRPGTPFRMIARFPLKG